jgi:hypothetical protein
MKKKNIMNDSWGQAFSLDIMLALIIVTVILGVSADAMDMVSYKAQDYSLRVSLERVTTDAADILIKSSGSPDKWENSGFSLDIVPGLAKKEEDITVPNTLSLIKILKLKMDYNQLMYGKILPEGVNSSMMIYPTNPSLSPLVIMNNTVPTYASEVAVANRTVLCEFMHVTTVVKMKGRLNSVGYPEQGLEWEVCPHNDHKDPDSKSGDQGWACHHFNVTAFDLNSTDFYVITDPASVTSSARWDIDRADAQTECKEKFSNGPILVNDKITAFMGNGTSAVLWFHILTKGGSKDSFEGYIVGVPKGTPLDQVRLDYLGPQPCFFVLQVWY